jgi:hypothetical protein
MSEILDRAVETLSEAQYKLQRLMEDAVAQHHYVDLTTLAPVADMLLDVIGIARGQNGSSVANPLTPRPQNMPSNGADVAAVPVVTRSHTYPRFERQGDRLIKIAWSKKERREYEHRMAAPVLLQVAQIFAEQGGVGTPFLMDRLMPFKMPNGEEIPSYQAYLALAWFRSLGFVESRGKDGYLVLISDLRRRVEQTWSDLPDTLRR